MQAYLRESWSYRRHASRRLHLRLLLCFLRARHWWYGVCVGRQGCLQKRKRLRWHFTLDLNPGHISPPATATTGRKRERLIEIEIEYISEHSSNNIVFGQFLLFRLWREKVFARVHQYWANVFPLRHSVVRAIIVESAKNHSKKKQAISSR